MMIYFCFFLIASAHAPATRKVDTAQYGRKQYEALSEARLTVRQPLISLLDH